MTHQQLTGFFTYSGLPFSRDPEAIRLLKKQLLLELKDSDSGWLLVDGKQYGVNEIIRLFDELPENGSGDYLQLLETFPVLERMYALGSVFTPIPVPEEITTDVRFPDFYRYELEPRLGKHTYLIETALKQNDLRIVAGLLSFAPLFPQEEQYRLFSRIILLLHNKMDVILQSLERNVLRKARPEEGYFTHFYYYTIVKQVADDDPDFLFRQYQVAEKYMKKTRYATASEVIAYQMKLSHGQEVRRVMAINKERFDGAPSNAMRGVYGVSVIAVIVLLRIFSGVSISSNHTPVRFDNSSYRDFYESFRKRNNDSNSIQPSAIPDSLQDSIR